MRGAVIGAGLAAVVITAAATPSPSVEFTFQIGGSGHYPTAIAVDAQGNSYVVASRYSDDPFPVSENAYEKSRRSMVVAKVAARGDRLVWATFLGGVNNRNWYTRGSIDFPYGIAVDPEGNVLVVGGTAATDFPTVNALVGAPQGKSSDGFLTKISADGSRLIYSTYLGDALPDAVATDFAGNAYIAMQSDSPLPFPVDKFNPDGRGRGVILKLNPAGGMIFGRRFGGLSTRVETLAVDGTGAIVVSGSTEPKDVPLVRPITSACWNYPSGQCSNPFIARFDTTGSRVLFSTMLGGTTEASSITSLALDPSGVMYVAGTTRATDFPIRAAYQPANAGGLDYILAKISADGDLQASTYLGSDVNDDASFTRPSVLVDASGRATFLGATGSLTGFGGIDHPDAPLYVTHDDGGSWTRSATGLRTSVYALAVSERDRTWYAATGDGVYRSIDGGVTWTRRVGGIASFYNGTMDSYALAVDPAHTGTLYAGTQTGTYRSTNRGDDWTKVDSATHMQPILTQHARLVVDGNGWVFLGNDDGIRRSRDGGQTWTDISTGLSKGLTGRYGPVDLIAFDPNSAGTIYTIHNNVPYRSRDGGDTWTRLDGPTEQGLGRSIAYGFGLAPGRRGRIFASVWTDIARSDDDGASWSPLNVHLGRGKFVVDTMRPDTLIVFDGWSGAPALITHDAGQSWRSFVMPTATPAGVTFDPTRPSTWFAPGNVRTLPILALFDGTLARFEYASFLNDVALPRAAAIDPSGAVYLLPSGARFAVIKIAPLHSLKPSRSGSR
jgi:photosystem II stability/assembly factor-like uncharacterized protein